MKERVGKLVLQTEQETLAGATRFMPRTGPGVLPQQQISLEADVQLHEYVYEYVKDNA